MPNKKYLITGTSSGLGRYLLEEYDGVPFLRNEIHKDMRHHQKKYDAIIHCATDSRNNITSNEILSYNKSHIELTRKLLQIPHDFFIFISSSAVYANPLKFNSESDTIYLPHDRPLYGLYGLFKLLAEQIVSQHNCRSLILRCVSIIGRTSRSTNIMRILRKDTSSLTLSADSSFNLVSMDQIKTFIDLALAREITGTFNTGSTQNATLNEIAEAIGYRPKFGNFIYNVHNMNTDKIRRISNDFDKSTIELAKIETKKIRI